MFSGLLHRQSLEPLKKIHSEHSQIALLPPISCPFSCTCSFLASFVFPCSSLTCTTKRIKSKTAHTYRHTHTQFTHAHTHTCGCVFYIHRSRETKNEFITQRCSTKKLETNSENALAAEVKRGMREGGGGFLKINYRYRPCLFHKDYFCTGPTSF